LYTMDFSKELKADILICLSQAIALCLQLQSVSW
jgi:hypothetical protein